MFLSAIFFRPEADSLPSAEGASGEKAVSAATPKKAAEMGLIFSPSYFRIDK